MSEKIISNETESDELESDEVAGIKIETWLSLGSMYVMEDRTSKLAFDFDRYVAARDAIEKVDCEKTEKNIIISNLKRNFAWKIKRFLEC